ncbi:extracellular solute-binding protein [Streptomyces sp. NPDC051104]|uniref:extracellular solute-binding protein n=1 Tax=Streptomyces sp. NPDC051104 TaxID=3155044 RepID=UPI003432037A
MLTARRRVVATAAVVLSGSLLLASCGGSDSGSSDGKTLKLWHYEGPDSAMGAAWNEAIKEFEAKHPGVKVKFEEKGFEQIQKTAPMVLNSSDAPDIMEYNKGNATAGLLSKQGLTWYRSESDLPSILDYDILKSNRTYLYYKGQPLYPFGYGLSYTTFRYGGLKRVSDGYEVKVTNTGRRAGDEVVQLYVHQRESRDKQPLKQLKAYERVSLKPGETKTVRLRLPDSDLAHWDVTRSKWVVETGTYDVMVGASSTDIRARTSLRVRGETIPPRDLSEVTRAENFDDYSAISLVDESKASGTAVSATAEGAWLRFADTRLGSGASAITARLAGAPGTLQVRLGSPTGRLVGTARFDGTSSPYTYDTVTAPLTGAKGRTDVYLVLSKGLRLSTFTLR